MGFASCADWNDAGVCYALFGIDGLLGHPGFWADVLLVYLVLLPGVSFCYAILCEEPFGLACVVYVCVVV